MIRAALVASALIWLTSCDHAAAPESSIDTSIADAERRAVADTDAALRDMAAPPAAAVTVTVPVARPAVAAIEAEGTN